LKRTIQETGSRAFKEKQSEFIGRIFPISSIQDFRKQLKSLKKEYHDSKHLAWAYRFQKAHVIEENCSDAGEPSGTAGLPILNPLKQNNFMNVGLVVIRYFGGIKLGKRGLIDAYEKSANDTISSVKPIPFHDKVQYHLSAPVDYYGVLSSQLAQLKGKIIEDQTIETIDWTVELSFDSVNQWILAVREVTQGKGTLNPKNK
jgi:uncharacterized YigZ family protein